MQRRRSGEKGDDFFAKASQLVEITQGDRRRSGDEITLYILRIYNTLRRFTARSVFHSLLQAGSLPCRSTCSQMRRRSACRRKGKSTSLSLLMMTGT